MPVSGNMQTRVIISAEDRGISRLMRRLSGECDATIAKFGQLGNTLAGLTATFTAGFGVKKAIGWLDEMEKSVFSIATTLTDTMHGLSSGELSDVFDRNAKHARAMYGELQKQAKRSIADVQELINAYQMFTNVGIAAPTNAMSAKQLDQLVTRVKLKTEGQNQTQQIFQEIRSLLQGRSNVNSVVSSQFSAVDANYKETIKRLVSKGDWNDIFDYLMTLITNIPLEEKINKLLSTKLKIVQGNIKEWSMEAFKPMYEEFGAALDAVGNEFAKEDSPFVKGLSAVVDRMTTAFAKARDSVMKFMKTDTGRWFAETTPKILAMAGAMTSLTMAVAGLKSVMGVFWTLPGIAMGAAMGYEALKTYNAQTGATFNGDWLSNKENGEFDWNNLAKGIEDGISSVLKTIGGTFMSFVKTTVDAAATLLYGIFEAVTGAIGRFTATIAAIYDQIKSIFSFIKDMVKEYYEIVKNYLSLMVSSVKEVILLGFNSLFVAIQSVTDRILGTFGILPGTSQNFFAWGRGSNLKSLNKVGADRQAANDNIEAAKARIQQITRDAQERTDKNLDLSGTTNFLTLLSDEFGAKRKDYWGSYKASAQTLLDNFMIAMNVNRAVNFNRSMDELSGNTDAVTQHRANEIQELAIKDYVRQGKELDKMLAQTANLDKAIADMEKLIAKGGDEYGAEMANVNSTMERFRKAAQMASASGETYSEKLAEYIEFMRGEGKENAELKAEKEKELSELYANAIDAAHNSFAERSVLFNSVYSQLAPELTRQANIRVANGNEERILGLLGTQTGSLSWNARAEAAANALSGSRQIRELSLARGGGQEGSAQAMQRRVETMKQYQQVLAQILPELEEQQRFYETQNQLLEKNHDVLAGVMQGMKEYVESVGSTFTQVKDLAVGAINTVSSTFGTVFYDYLTGQLKSFKEYFRSFLQSMLKMWADAVAQMIAKAAVMGSLKLLTGMFSPATAVASANGNVLRGGFRAFANGGVVSGPTLGLVGEGRYNEAVVPLPDGRRIPVQMQGGGNVVVNVIDNTNSGIEKNVSQKTDDMGRLVIDIVLDAVSRNRGGFRNKLRGQLQTA